MADLAISAAWNDPVQAGQHFKTCTRCGASCDPREFPRDKQKRDGLSSICRDCNRAKSLAWAQKNTEQNRARAAAWKAANPDKARQAGAEWRAKNAERKRAKDAKRRRENPELVRLQSSARRARQRAAGGHVSRDIVRKLYALQKGKCPCCAAPLGRDFHLDHIVPLVDGGSHDDGNLQLLTGPCNLRKNRKDPIAYMQEKGFLL